MFRIIHAKFAKDKMRIAMGLPEKLGKPALERFDALQLALPVEEEVEDEEEEEEEEIIEELLEEEAVEEEDFSLEELTVEEIMDELDESLEEMELEEEDILMIPDELPDQLFLSGELFDETDIIAETDDYVPEEIIDASDSILERARAALAVEEEVVDEVSEDELMKMELRDRITSFITSSPELALKLFRVFYNQDNQG
jgi:hypothetical protein